MSVEKVKQIYERAKKGEGLIRYKGKVSKAYLPLPDEMGGIYELIQLVKNAKKNDAQHLLFAANTAPEK